ncbi:MAG TPA: hypothetical protein PKA00_05840 [Saprospiraceae bacterium]|nr:hypothetical protein [Saprospiraceae bacterium]HMQ82404.1 hypothetical protein [Saprospiraceae bacterium]
MGLFDRLFSPKHNEINEPYISFGRYSDSYKETIRYDAWNRALEAFENENFLESYRQFFFYLKDEKEGNVKCWEENGLLRFELLQGSKKITGYANPQKLRAEAKVVKVENLNVGFMRRLMEQNFDLKYSRFSLDEDNNICIVFDTYVLDGSPYKLYYALKELAVKADKQDDLLMEEFQVLQAVDSTHLENLPDEEKKVKYDFIKAKIEEVMYEIDNGKLNKLQYAGSFSFLLLDLIYRLDYLVKPEGYMMEALERMHRQYYENNGQPVVQKNELLCKSMRELAARPQEEFFKEMYRVKSTFGITHSVNHDRISSFIDAELYHIDWYMEHGHTQIALSIPGYIVGYCMFNYAVPKPDREYFHLYYQIMEPAYFNKLGFSPQYYDPGTGQFDKKGLIKAIKKIASDNKLSFPKLHPATGTLAFDNLAVFAKSYLLMVRNLDMTKVD